MKLGFVSAILPDLSLEEVVAFAAETGYTCVELMCWPLGGAERRYAGVTHVDVEDFDAAKAEQVNATMAAGGIEISGLGYYPNPLTPVAEEAAMYVEHIKKVITAAEILGVGVVNTFVGRDWTKSVDDNWPRFKETWVPLIKFAEDHDVKIGIENCPMLFTADEWPGGKNLAHSPAIWARMFEEIPSENFGLNFDPSHLVWQFIDCDRAIRDFAGRIVHAHAKDAKIERHKLAEMGIFGRTIDWHTPKLPGMGDVKWGKFFSSLTDAGYQGPVCVEVEDRAYEETLELRKLSLRQSKNFLSQYIP
jgi:sugar phosphate isomerase/epimerase